MNVAHVLADAGAWAFSFKIKIAGNLQKIRKIIRKMIVKCYKEQF